MSTPPNTPPSAPPNAPPVPTEPAISFVNAEKLSQREQIEAVLTRARERQEPLRVRLPFTLYDYQEANRTYIYVRDATWNLQLPSDQIGVETVERLMFTLGQCIKAVATLGTEETLRRLEAPGGSLAPPVDGGVNG